MNARASAPCAQRHAYVAMLTAQGNGTSAHDGSQGSFIQDALSHGALRSIVDQLAVLARSLRRFELCRHDFVLLLGVAVALDAAHRELLRAESFILRPIAPLEPMLPHMDKLHAWLLTDYSSVVYLDADAVAVRAIDHLFDEPSLTMAAHAHDLVQGRCGIPSGERVNSGCMVLRPDRAAFERLRRHAAASPELWGLGPRADKFVRATPEQTGLACASWAHGSLHTLHCATFYDIGLRFHRPNSRHHRGCIARSGRSKDECDAAAKRAAGCLWPQVRRNASVIHFKGKLKPWKHTLEQCLPLRAGALRLADQAGEVRALAPTDDLEWRQPGCVSADHGRRVTFGNGARIPYWCCKFDTLLKAHWWALRGNGSATQRYFGSGRSGFW
eukprot:Transcript_30664.p1 GENE.Transcript_30664~~Transcript_30664.p1  ORF type:complete len:426 (-),score=58.41 Transcript_30664:115-1272(-)